MSCKEVSNRRCVTFVRAALVHLLAACSVTSTACSGPHLGEPGARSTAALIGGSLSLAERDAVVFIRANHPDGSFADCTGTLLSPQVVITAKHCVTLLRPGAFVCTGAGALVENGDGAGLFGSKVEGSGIEIYTGTAPVGAAAAHVLTTFTSDSSDACHDDIAALVLDTPIQQDFYPMLRVSRAVLVGERVRLVGYGTVGHGALIERRELADIRVTDVGRVDGAHDANANTPARSFTVGGGTACFGDSGGPALSMETGALTGVYSRITGDCFAVESRNSFILASSFVELFQRAFSQAGEQPQVEPGPGITAEHPFDAGDSGAATTGGSSALTESTTPTQTTRHEALRCSFGRSNSDGLLGVTWVLVALATGFIRRRCAGRLS